MNRLAGNLWIRVLAVILIMLLAAAFLLGCGGLLLTANRDLDGLTRSFSDSWLGKRAAIAEGNILINRLINGEVSDKADVDPAFSYILYSERNEVLADTTRDNSRDVKQQLQCYLSLWELEKIAPEYAQRLRDEAEEAAAAVEEQSAGEQSAEELPVEEPHDGEPEVTPEASQSSAEVTPHPTAIQTVAPDPVPAEDNEEYTEIFVDVPTLYQYDTQLCLISCFINPPVTSASSYYGYAQAFDLGVSLRGLCISTIALSLVISVLLFAFLMLSAGMTPDGGVALRGFNRLPLDVYFLILVLPVFVFALFGARTGVELGHTFLEVGLMALGAWLVLFFLLCFCITLSARLRAGHWWRNTIVFMLCRFLYRVLAAVARAMPVAWKPVLAFLVYMALVFILLWTVFDSGAAFIALLLWLALIMASVVIIVSVVKQLLALQKGGEAIAQGQLDSVVENTHMFKPLRRHAENLNSISVGVSRAVDERMKSERFKTELITNVSHDLKTPLTSIVSYVDLLKKEDIQSKTAREYIDVLERQAAKLKKLTVDLVDASKASSGTLTVNAERLDLTELLTQCAGEYEERLHASGLESILTCPDREVPVCVDGRLLSRVLDNLMQNAAKYSLPGTRVYLDLRSASGRAELSIKNISREALNIPASELMERFVRGDYSRHTEGSGLGLSIAKSLTELMNGRLDIYLDGDLFKATVSFPLQTALPPAPDKALPPANEH